MTRRLRHHVPSKTRAEFFLLLRARRDARERFTVQCRSICTVTLSHTYMTELNLLITQQKLTKSKNDKDSQKIVKFWNFSTFRYFALLAIS